MNLVADMRKFCSLRKWSLGFILGVALTTAGVSQVLIPQRVGNDVIVEAPYASTGILETRFGRSSFRGSGTIARDPRLIFTAAHVSFDRGRWADEISIAIAWNGGSDAPLGRYQRMRGYRFFSSYATNVAQYGDESDEAFNTDFLVGFTTQYLGNAVGVRSDGAGYLANGLIQKFILGYPAERDRDGVNGYYYMHRTGPFNTVFTQLLDAYYYVQNVSTGSGNSGGPVFETSSGSAVLAGILISGTEFTAGVYAIDPPALKVSSNALSALNSAPPAATPTPGSRMPGAGSSLVSSLALNELNELRETLVARMAQIRKIKNLQARVIQLRRIRTLLMQVNQQIQATS
jgi:V8-like Glu-specific endopeptidase